MKYLNFKVLFDAQKLKLTPADVEEMSISTSKALMISLKYTLLKSISQSQKFIAKDAVVLKTVTVPDMLKLLDKNVQEL